jgi:RHH-type proline utilization regulon transcriptional repressor/proline dehydrogenase/delta 1-pyrroline-5-carboxylate dehydrogenase
MAHAMAVRSDRALEAARALLARARAGVSSRAERAELAEQLAALLLDASRAETRADERARKQLLARLVHDPAGQVFTSALTDRIFRSRDPQRVVDQLRHLSLRFGAPRSVSALDRVQLRAARIVGALAPGLVAPKLIERVRDEARSVLLRAEAAPLHAFLKARRSQGVRVNVNQLGEALLGEREAEARVAKYATLAQQPGIDALSVKVSSIGSQLNLLAFEESAELLARRLSRIYEASLARPRGERPVIMLDMEAYQDVALTFEVLTRALASQALREVHAGMVIQAYLPDANALLRDFCVLSAARVAEGAEPLRLRLVKGANLAHERVESEKAGLALPMFDTKADVDANFKRLLEHATRAAATASIRLGVASHNLFDLAYALVLRAAEQAEAGLGVEMLEGMANDSVRAIRALDVDVLVYAPICSNAAMSSGIAYLVRRLDENTASDNFLRSSFEMQPGDAAFERERLRFREALARIDGIDETPRRVLADRGPRPGAADTYRGEPDSDFARAETRAWLREALAQTDAQTSICSQLAGQAVAGVESIAGEDPSCPGVVPYRVELAGAADIERALACAADDPSGFSRWSVATRDALLQRIAAGLRARRAELIRALVRDGAKRVPEADAEVSEAIDFAEYYRFSYRALCQRTHGRLSARGSVLVTPPWNFPLAIAAGGVLAALISGNRVILKPALETPWVGALLAQVMWDAGVPREALQLALCRDEVASALVRDPRIDSVILTGATETAQLFQRMRPGLHLLAETGGKNPYVVSAMSDRELAIRDVVQSAFGHAGQKCSACSLLILEAEVHDDPHFMETLADAVQSLCVGSAWQARSFVTPLIREPGAALARALGTLEAGESWLVEPGVDPNNPRLLSPGVKLGVAPGSFMHTTELFGPVLSVMRATSLDHAIELANASGYALTAGLASLDEREQTRFCAQIRAGNIYINRTITGAIVQRQPFGGFGKSGFGPGAKAGGPNYVAQLCRVSDVGDPPRRGEALPEAVAPRLAAASRLLPEAERARLAAFVQDYAHARRGHFGLTHAFTQVLGQDNLFSYRPREGCMLRVERDATLFDALASCLAAELCGTALLVSVAPDFAQRQALGSFVTQSCCEDLARLEARAPATWFGSRAQPHAATYLRLLGTRQAEHAQLSSRLGAHLADEPVLGDAGFELLHYLREQSISIDYHRYGNLGARGLRP